MFLVSSRRLSKDRTPDELGQVICLVAEYWFNLRSYHGFFQHQIDPGSSFRGEEMSRDYVPEVREQITLLHCLCDSLPSILRKSYSQSIVRELHAKIMYDPSVTRYHLVETEGEQSYFSISRLHRRFEQFLITKPNHKSLSMHDLFNCGVGGVQVILAGGTLFTLFSDRNLSSPRRIHKFMAVYLEKRWRISPRC